MPKRALHLSPPRGGQEIDPVAFALANPERVRLTKWPPSSPYRVDDVNQDDLALR